MMVFASLIEVSIILIWVVAILLGLAVGGLLTKIDN